MINHLAGFEKKIGWAPMIVAVFVLVVFVLVAAELVVVVVSVGDFLFSVIFLLVHRFSPTLNSFE
jgi:hypothetical protein